MGIAINQTKNGFISISSINRRFKRPFRPRYINWPGWGYLPGYGGGGLSAWPGRGCLLPGEGCLPGVGCLLGWGGCLPDGGCLPGHGVLPGQGVHLPVDRMTDACENITFPQLLLRTVKITYVQPGPSLRDPFGGGWEKFISFWRFHHTPDDQCPDNHSRQHGHYWV